MKIKGGLQAFLERRRRPFFMCPGRLRSLGVWWRGAGAFYCLLALQPALATPFGSATIRLADKTLRVEVAETAEARTIGYSGREDIPLGQGMLFVFQESLNHCMWMKNTRVPLIAVFISDANQIIGSQRMQPLTETRHCSPAPVRLILEVPDQSLAEKDLRPGSKVLVNPERRLQPEPQ